MFLCYIPHSGAFRYNLIFFNINNGHGLEQILSIFD